MSDKKIGLALCGGGARALCHIGVLKALEGLELDYHCISGTSQGALIGASYCSGTSIKELEEYVGSLDWRSMLMFTDLSLSRMGMINGKKVEQVLERFLKDKTFKDAGNFCCTAVDIIKEEVKVLKTGKLIDAVRASISVPILFKPVKRKGMVLIDGGVIDPLPIEALRPYEPDIIIAVSIDLSKKKEIKPDEGGLDSRYIMETIFNIIHRESSHKNIDDADIVIKPEVGDFGFFDFYKGKEIIRKGTEAAEKMIPEIRRRLGK